MAKRYGRLPSFVPEWIRKRVEVDMYAIADFVDRAAASTVPGDRVLDAGAGEGRFKSAFAHARYTGVDLAVGDADWDYRNLDAICDLIGLPFARATFDAAICVQVLEHVPDPPRMLRQIAQVLRPGGRLFLSAPQSWPQHQKPYDFYRYTSFGIRHLLQTAGLEIESIDPIGGYFWSLSFQLQNINLWLFPRGMHGRAWTWPVRGLLGLVFQLLLPLALFYLDGLDRVKDETFGYFCVAVKPGKNT